MKSTRLLAENVIALLKERGHTQKDLADWCGHSGSWISDILKGERQFQMKDLDRVADFFGKSPYELMQPGHSALTERRQGSDRRADSDRRTGHAQRQLGALKAEVTQARHKEAPHEQAHRPTLPAAVQAIIADFERKLTPLLAEPPLRRQDSKASVPVSKARKGRGGAGGSVSGET